MMGFLILISGLALVVGIFATGAYRSSRVLGELYQQFKAHRNKPKEKQPLKAIIAHPESYREGGYLPSKKQTFNSYNTLLSKVVGQGDNAKAIELLSSVTWNAKDDHRHFQFFGELQQAMQDEISPHFIFTLDWRAAVGDLKWHIEGALKDTDYKPALPNPDKYPKNASVQYGQNKLENWNEPHKLVDPITRTGPVFEDYIRALNDVGLGLGFMETLSDHFALFIFEVKDIDELWEVVMKTGSGPGLGYCT